MAVGSIRDGRFDADFHSPSNQVIERKLDASPFKRVELNSVILSLAGGATPRRSDESQYAEAQSGVHFLRIQNVTEHGLNLSDVKFVTHDTHNNLLERSQLKLDDVLMTITGRIGSTSVVNQEVLPANINQHIVQIRPDKSQIEPKYLADYLNSNIGRAFSNRGVTGTTRVALDYSAVSSIPLLLPPIETQTKLVAELETAREFRRSKLAQADALLSSLDEFLLGVLGLERPPADTRNLYAVRLGDLNATKRVDPDYFHPERVGAIRHLEKTSPHRAARLCDIVEFCRSKAEAADGRYLGLAGVQSKTGEYSAAGEEADGACFWFQENDVLFARLRPYLNKVWRAE